MLDFQDSLTISRLVNQCVAWLWGESEARAMPWPCHNTEGRQKILVRVFEQGPYQKSTAQLPPSEARTGLVQSYFVSLNLALVRRFTLQP